MHMAVWKSLGGEEAQKMIDAEKEQRRIERADEERLHL